MEMIRRIAIGAVFITTIVTGSIANGAGKIEIDDTKWISVGLGLRTSFTAQEDKAPNGDWGNDFQVDNLRLYVNGQIHRYIKVEFNTECNNCVTSDSTQEGGNMIILDAIGKFEFNQYFNIWAGRQLVPQHRGELDGPFFQNVYTFVETWVISVLSHDPGSWSSCETQPKIQTTYPT